MEMNLTFTENRSIKILILPIGDISPEKYKEYTNLIKTINIIELSSITRSQNESTPFEKMSWVDGSMILNFIDATSYQRSEYEDFQIYKKVFGVIGVVDCKKSKDLTETKRLFEQAVAQYPSCVSSLCCAFDPMDDQQDLGLGANLIMIPNNSDRKHLIFYLTTLLIDFSNMILKYFEKMVSSYDGDGNTIVSNLNGGGTGGGSSSSTPNSNSGIIGSGVSNLIGSNNNSLITTPLDSVKLWDEIGRAKKRKLGRLNKCRGDYCLLAGSPLDAIRYYDLSIESCRNNNDWEWLAGSCEGYISAVLLKRNQEYNTHNIHQHIGNSRPLSPLSNLNNLTVNNITPRGEHGMVKNHSSGSLSSGNNSNNNTPGGSGGGNNNNNNSNLNYGINVGGGNILELQIQTDDLRIRELANEAKESYNKRRTGQFEIDLMLKFANYHISMERKIEASELLTSTYDLAGTELSFADKITVSCSIALLYYSMGFKRKFAFYLREAAFLYNTKPENWEKINHLLIIATKYYQLEDLFSNSPSRFLDELGNSNKTLSFTLTQMKKSSSVNRSGSKNSSPHSGQQHQFQPSHNQFYQPQPQQQQGNNNQYTNTARPLIKNNTNVPELSNRKPKFGWSVIQRYLIYNLISVSTNLLDSLNICKYIIYLLRTQYKQITQQKQVEFQLDLLHHSKTLSLSINTNVHMNSLGLPFINKVVPMALPDHLEPSIRPIVSATTAAAENKFFIYSPYEKLENLQVKKIVWTEQEECNVLVSLSNPFSFDIFIQSLTLSTSGVPFESYPLSFKILSLTESMDIVISGRPLSSGPLIIKGVFIRAYNLLSEHPIDPQGRSISLNKYNELLRNTDSYKVVDEIESSSSSSTSGSSMISSHSSTITSGNSDETVVNKIKVTSKLPLLNVTVPTLGNTLNLLAGENYDFNFSFENISKNVSIDSIVITLLEFDKSLKKKALAESSSYITDQDDESTSFSWLSSIISENLPLLPGKSFILPIKIYSKPFLIGNRFEITYFSNNGNNGNIGNIDTTTTTTTVTTNTNSNTITTAATTATTTTATITNYQRKINIPLQMFVTHGPQVINFDIVYASSKIIKSLTPYLVDRSTNGTGSNNIFSVKDEEYDTSSENIYNDYCLLLFDIKNCTSTHTFTISSELDSVITSNGSGGNGSGGDGNGSMNITPPESKFILSPNGIITIIVPMKRESLPDQLPMLRQAKGQYIKPKKKLTEYEEYLNRLIQYYKDLLTSSIKLNWISSDNSNGIILLHNIVLTPKLIHKLNKDSVLIEFKNNQQLSKTLNQGDFEKIEICVTNLTNSPISGLVLHIQPTVDQHQSNGNNGKSSSSSSNNINNNDLLSNKLGYIGSLTTPIQELPPNSTFNHSIDFIFFERDTFKFIITCELFKTKQIIPSSHSLLINVV